MEAPSIRQCVKRKRKKRKLKQSVASNGSFLKPELFDGMTNWLKLQKVLPTVTKERVPENSSRYKGKYPNRKLYKKMGLKKGNVQTDIGAKGHEKKPQYKFDFAERKASLCPSRNSIDDSKDFNRGNSKVKSPDLSSDGELSDHSQDETECKRLTKTIALDCEMVGTGPEGNDSVLARVSIVNAYGDCIYDEFVKPKERVTDFRTEISGVRPADLKRGKDLYEVQEDVKSIIQGRRLVGHDLKHDFNVLFMDHPKSMIRDTARYNPFREVSGGRTPSLKKLATVFLNCSIQSGEHSSIVDAQAAMLLYLGHKKEWEKSVRSKWRKKR